MGVIWQITLSNAVLVAAGTPIVWLIGRYARRPALTHGLAVILLLKLITPPLWRIPVNWPEETPATAMTIEKQIAPIEAQQTAVVSQDAVTSTDLQVPARDLIIESSPPPVSGSPPALATPSVPKAWPFDFARWLRQSLPILGWSWVAGSALCSLVAVTRVVRFTRVLRFAARARDVQPRADMLARRLGLRRSPAVWFVPAFVSPMLWDLGGRPRLLLPVGLWERLDIAGRDTILLHELAHWRRGDHLVRWIELLATCFYWWHPACWWARRELREAEEQCCDAWVLWAMPGVFKNYANALVEAVEFASIGAASARTAVPVLASRMGQFVHLRRRLTMLKHGNIARVLSWSGLAGVTTLGSIVLPLAPTWGQEQPAPQDQTVRVAEPATPQASTPAPASAMAQAMRTMTPEQLNYLKVFDNSAELAKARQTIAELERELTKARAQLKFLEVEGVARVMPTPPSNYIPAPPVDPVPGAMPVPEKSPFRTAQPDFPTSAYNAATTPPVAGSTATPGVHDGQYRVIITDPATGRIKEIQTRALRIPSDQVRESQSDRLDKIEVQLRLMVDELAKMRAINPYRPDSPPLPQ